MTRVILFFLLTVTAQAQVSRTMAYRSQRHAAPAADGSFTYLIEDHAFAGDGVAETPDKDTTGCNLFVVNAGCSSGSNTVWDTAGNVYIAGTPIGDTVGGTNQMWYTINPTTSANHNFIASNSVGGNVQIDVYGFSCTGTPVLDAQSPGAGSATFTTLQPGSLAPTGTELFVTGYSSLEGAEVDSGFTRVNGYEAYKMSSTSENPTWTGNPDISGAVGMMMFGASGGGGGGSTTFITSGHGVSQNGTTGYYVGYAFTPSANITVTDLGFMMLAGNTQSHAVYLMSEFPLAIIAQTAALPTSGVTPDTYIFGSVTPTALLSGTEYFLLVDSVTGDHEYDDTVDIVTTADGVIGSSRYTTSFGTTPSINYSGSRGITPPNLKYTKP